ncbi:MAG: peptidylprolyl isomerase [Sinimarinibacterium sp.]|jgi:parvulin-like peptidyl-prolyl isomerase
MKVSHVGKLILPVFLLCLGAQAAAAGSDAKVISQSDQLSLTTDDYRNYFANRDPKELKQLASEDKLLIDRVLDVHSDSALMREAQRLGLDQEPRIQRQLEDTRRRILASAVLENAKKTVDMSQVETLARERYTQQKDKLRTPERRKVAHMLFKSSTGDCPCDKRPPAIDQARAVHKKLMAGGDFAQLAKENSADAASAKNGGVIEKWIEQNKETPPAFEDTVFDLAKVGDFSDAFKTQFGAHIVRLLEIDPSRQLGYEEVHDKLVEQIRTDIVTAAINKQRSLAYPDPTKVDLTALRGVLETLQAPTESQPATQGTP